VESVRKSLVKTYADLRMKMRNYESGGGAPLQCAAQTPILFNEQPLHELVDSRPQLVVTIARCGILCHATMLNQRHDKVLRMNRHGIDRPVVRPTSPRPTSTNPCAL